MDRHDLGETPRSCPAKFQSQLSHRQKGLDRANCMFRVCLENDSSMQVLQAIARELADRARTIDDQIEQMVESMLGEDRQTEEGPKNEPD